MDLFLIDDDDDLLEKYNTIWDNAMADIKRKNLIATLYTTKFLWKSK